MYTSSTDAQKAAAMAAYSNIYSPYRATRLAALNTGSFGENQDMMNNVVFPLNLSSVAASPVASPIYSPQGFAPLQTPNGTATANAVAATQLSRNMLQLSPQALNHAYLNAIASGGTIMPNLVGGSPGTQNPVQVLTFSDTNNAAKLMLQLKSNVSKLTGDRFNADHASSAIKMIDNDSSQDLNVSEEYDSENTESRKRKRRQRRLCEETECNKFAQGGTLYCISHGGGRRCHIKGCSRSAHGTTSFCISHGGGIQCEVAGCQKSIQGNTKRCKGHGGGKRCRYRNCDKAAQDSTEYCKGHGGGRRCNFPMCVKSARGKTGFCVAHGGGKRCQFPICAKSAAGSTSFCIAHGGGKRCKHTDCKKSALGATSFCFAHGGGRKCMYENCKKASRGSTKYCVQHGGGRRCQAHGCNKGAQGATFYCVKHGGKKIRTNGIAVKYNKPIPLGLSRT
mmetsp:Transcript_6095/g.7344  ORF Transcript_6095/g.7344 Transcript_6095/m.7344 type:complete len:451 (-) Transcript_6095:77-1429(-)